VDGTTTVVYPGDRFGREEPIPSIRLKIQRNCLQDLALLDSLRNRHPLEALKSEAAKRYNNSRLENWWNPRPPFADQPALEWTNTGIDEATSRTSKMLESIRPDAWADVHAYVMQLISEAP